MSALFTPFSHNGLHLKNRIVMAPMSRYLTDDGIPGPGNAAYYRRRAENEVGLILSEGAGIDRPASRNNPGIPFFHGARAMAGWQQIIAEVHAAGGKMGPQLWHTGSFRKIDWDTPEPVESPSGLVGPGNPRGRTMTEADIHATIDAYARSALAAKQMGFDVVEVHGAHGYLIDQFFWAGTNARADRWGGPTIGERARFGAEVVRAVREGIGEDIPLILRLSQWKSQDYEAKNAHTPDELAQWLAPLSEAGVDVFHCSQRRFWEPEFEGSDLNFAGWAKTITGKPTISVGSVGLDGEFLAAFRGAGSEPASLDGLIERLERDEFDLVAVGRALLADPHWVEKIRDGRTDDLLAFDKSYLARLT